MVPAEAAYLIAAGVFGLLFGSFLNVCIYRIPRDLSVVFPRSFCPECGQQIAWYDNVPIVSYAILRGRCRACARPIGLRYPFVELITASVLVLTAWRYGWTLAALKWALFECLVIVLFWTDVEERILPDELTLGGTVAGLLFACFVPVHAAIVEVFFGNLAVLWRSLVASTLGIVLLAGPIWGVGAIYKRVRGREGLGLGDVKLLALVGVFLGVEQGVLALMIGAISGAGLGVLYVLITRKDMSTYELPFGSFLCLGAAILPLLKNL